MELVAAEAAAFEHAGLRVEDARNLGLQLRRPRQRVAIDLQHIRRGDRVLGRVEIADVGEQKAQRVADAAVGVHHPRQNLVVDVEVAGIVGGRYPQAHNFGAQFFVEYLRLHRVAQAFAHFAALAVGRETVRQQAAVGRAVIQSATQQQRAVEPTPVLVVALQIQVRFRPGRMEGRPRIGVLVAAAQYVLEGGAGIEPDFEDIGALGVAVRVITRLVQDVVHRGAAPGLDTAALHHLCR